MRSTILFVPLLAASYAYAHGFVSTVTIDGKGFTGNVPNGKTDPSVVRQINDVGPVKGASNPDVNCGHNAQAASLVADANPGSSIAFDWAGGDLSKWPHNTGPMMTYMASCGSTSCANFNSQTAKWFKIQQVGRKDNGQWAQADLMTGAAAQVTIPSTLAAGNYLIRHEILALHLATSQGGAEFYPSCTQLRVGGNQNGAPTAAELVSLPGVYSDTDPGILVPDVFNTNAKYVFPGPDIAQFVAASSGSPSGSASNSSVPASSASSATASSTAAASKSSSGSCRLKKKPTSAAANAVATPSPSPSQYYPRHLSRVMRRLAFSNIH